jgi:hypothetical protein
MRKAGLKKSRKVIFASAVAPNEIKKCVVLAPHFAASPLEHNLITLTANHAFTTKRRYQLLEDFASNRV